jgi:hypothetical protein
VRIFLAISCFFRILFGRPLPPALAGGGGAGAKALPGPSAEALRAAERAGAVTMLAVLQREGRLVDFLEEEIEGYDDAHVGAAVRDIHRGCRKALRERVGLAPVLREKEGATVTVPEGFDAAAIRLTGAVAGAPPFEGTLRHPGWRAAKVDLPKAAGGDVVAPAEVEVG